MPVCSVVGCRTGHSRHAQHFTSFHRFPKDPALFTEWIRRTGVSAAGCSEAQEGSWQKRHVCGGHFTEKDYDKVWQSKLNL